jgi:hypothetical protein
MASFLVVYDRAQGAVLSLNEFADQHEALLERFRLEREYEDDESIEVVVLVAESEKALHTTHARYFTSFKDLMRGFSAKPA